MEIKPIASAIPADHSKLEQGKWGPIFPRGPSCYGFSVIAKIKPGTEANFYQHARNLELFHISALSFQKTVGEVTGQSRGCFSTRTKIR
jgi:hypothetical protein